MFGIGGGEFIFIIFIALMLFGADKIPDIARTMGKTVAQFKNATNDIKNEIHKGADANGLTNTINELKGNFQNITSNINNEINQAKENIASQATPHIDSVKEGIDEITGPIKRQN